MYNVFKLNNGLRVVVENTDFFNSVSVGLWIENGSRNEDEKNSGISHFIEHMLFKGTSNRSGKDIVEAIEDVGGQINAFTGKEATCFYIKALDSHLELALDVLSDMLFNHTFSHEDIEKEKGVVIEEINMNEDSPEDVLADLHSVAAWGKDSISLPILGTIETVKSFTREQLKEYVESYYIPENSVISISGRFDSKSIQKLIEKYFGSWECRNKKITKYSTPILGTNHLLRKKNIEQLHISLGIPGIEIGNDDMYPLLILNNTLGGSASSILFQKIREELGICYSIYSYITSLNNTGLISIYAGLNPSFGSQALSVICEEIEKFSRSEITKEKLLKAKEQLKGNYVLGLESTSSRMFANGKSLLFLNKVSTPEDIIHKIDIIDSNKLMEVMERTFKKGVLNSAYVGEHVDLEELAKGLKNDIVAYRNIKSLEV